MHFSLQGKTAIVTGGASGIGLAIVKRLIAAGARVLVADRRPAGADIAKAAGADFFQADVSQEEQIAAMFDAAKMVFGRVDILVNNAGIQPLGVGFEQLTGDILRRTLEVNVNGTAFGIKHAARSLADNGRVINLASFVRILATPGGAAPSTSKAAVIHLTKLGAIELAARRITVNAISPGTILTPAVTEIPDKSGNMPGMEKRTPLADSGQPRGSGPHSAISWPPRKPVISPDKTSRSTVASPPAGWNMIWFLPPTSKTGRGWTIDDARNER